MYTTHFFFIFFWLFLGLISCGFTVLNNLDCFNCGLVDFGLNTLFFPCLFLSTSSHSPFTSLSCLNFSPPPPPSPVHKSFLPSSLSCQLSPPSLPFTQGQRHEESACFPAEEEWIPRKQPSRQVGQVYEVSQVSGHFLTACACGHVGVCETVCSGSRHTTGDDLALEDRHVGSKQWRECGGNKKEWGHVCLTMARLKEGEWIVIIYIYIYSIYH